MKVPADHEPVIHPATDVVIAVLGMRAVGRPLEEVCFRASRAAAILEVDKDHTVTPEDFAKLFLSSRGGKKNVGAREYICIINQCDSEAQRRAALPALRLLREAGVRAAVAGR